MKPRGYIFLLSIPLSLSCLPAQAQVSFKTVVPQHAIAPGESFQVQYVLENAAGVSGFSSPKFQGFRVVAGPNIYSGKKSAAYNKSIPYKNLVFTLAAVGEGKFKINGAVCTVNGKLIKSNDAIVKVISPKEYDQSSYFLKAGEDPLKKIRENLFLKLIIDKQTCFIGEPLIATFKLYSRLQSRSNVIKNPGFYGFSVYDMINVNDKIQSEEKFKGHWFDVHTIRKVQLYPLQGGTFTIDAMELSNKIEFSRSMVTKKTEQEISENMYGGNRTDNKPGANTEVYEMNIKTDPVLIKVKPLPGKNVTDTFAGAVGNFSIAAFLEKDSLLRNEESSLIIEINGAGNFQRISSPVINWPQAIEAFEPSTKDTLDKRQVPLTGQRSFKYIFLSNKPGHYSIPPVSFSFFDLKTRTYKTASTKILPVFIKNESKPEKAPVPELIPAVSNKSSAWWLLVSLLFVLIAGIFLWLKNKQSAGRRAEEKRKMNESANPSFSTEEIFMATWSALDSEDQVFYKELDLAIWNYFKHRLRLSGSQMNKVALKNILITKKIRQDLVGKLVEIIHQCETGMYTNAEMNLNKKDALKTTEQIIRTIEDSLNAD
jgi:hypothetical protein